MRALLYIFAAQLVLGLFSCRSSETYRAYAASIDSLGGAIATLETQLKSVNETELAEMKSRYVAYRTFIKQHVTDTISQSEASELQRFEEAGTQLEAFSANRQSLAERASLIKEQLLSLAKDVRTKSAGEERIREYLANEKFSAGEFAAAAREELSTYHQATKQFRISLATIGNMIRKRNNGELPRMVTNQSL